MFNQITESGSDVSLKNFRDFDGYCLQKQPSIVNLLKKGSEKKSTLHGKTPVLEFLVYSREFYKNC